MPEPPRLPFCIAAPAQTPACRSKCHAPYPLDALVKAVVFTERKPG